MYGGFSALASSMGSFQMAGVFHAGGSLLRDGKVTFVGIFR